MDCCGAVNDPTKRLELRHIVFHHFRVHAESRNYFCTTPANGWQTEKMNLKYKDFLKHIHLMLGKCTFWTMNQCAQKKYTPDNVSWTVLHGFLINKCNGHEMVI